MRKLVTIRKIDNLVPIKGKDRIELAVIGGWSTIIKKGEIKEGDLCVFFEIDSFLPMEDKYAFLKKVTTFEGKEGYRLRSMKMSGVISQGLALPLSTFDIPPPQEGDDVTKLLNVIKYDVAVTSQATMRTGKPAGNFPPFIPKTDQPRIQNLTHYFDTLQGHEFEETLKLDGSSMTCYKTSASLPWWKTVANLFGANFSSNHFGVCSRNLEISRPDSETKSDFWKAADRYSIEHNLPSGFAVQGELIGPKIQSNHEKVSTLQYYIFDVYDIANSRYLLPVERAVFCHGNDLPHVPIINSNTSIFKHHTLESLLKHVEGESMNPNTISEGRVYKSTINPQLHFKVISNKYLLSGCDD